MLKHKTIAFSCRIENFVKAHFLIILSILVLSAAAITTFAYQNAIVGFERGYDELASKHHGSVSSRGLAIIAQAKPENGFVGYAIRYKDEQNNLVYDYFDRYPVFFSAAFNQVLSLRPKLSSKIYLAKQVMNLIFVATLFVAFLLSDKLIRNKALALFAVLVTFANPYLMFYKDMVHFDQPALFGFLLLTYAIALYKIDGLRWPMYAATFIAVALGRGYASYAVLGLWLLIEGVLILRTRHLGFWEKVKCVVRHPSFRLMVIGVVWGASLLSYNIVVEARTKNVSILETSIVDSAGRRLALNEKFNQENEHIINWPGYLQSEVSRIIKWASPVKWPNPDFLISLVILLLMFLVMWIAIRRQQVEYRVVFIILALSGFAWLIPMRNLAAFHDYTTMYFIGVPLVFFLSALILLKPSKDAAVYLALMGMVVYINAVTEVKDLHESIADNANAYTYDFMRIEEAIGSEGNNVHVIGSVPYGINAVEFYLQDQYIAPLSLSDYVISGDKNYSPENLTPDNTLMYLFRKSN